jgi:hypothetical protein
MKIGVSAMERAFQLARSGKVAGMTDIKETLKQEGYAAYSIEGPALAKQLREIIKASRSSGNLQSPAL